MLPMAPGSARLQQIIFATGTSVLSVYSPATPHCKGRNCGNVSAFLGRLVVTNEGYEKNSCGPAEAGGTRSPRSRGAESSPISAILYEVGPDYLMMEPIDGKALSGPLQVDQALKWLHNVTELPACSALCNAWAYCGSRFPAPSATAVRLLSPGARRDSAFLCKPPSRCKARS
jgi:hypothetical protein